MDAISDLLDGLLALLTPLITPDWGALVGLLPVLLLVPVIGYLLWTVRRWARFNAQLPRSLRGRLDVRTALVVHAGGVLLGALVVAASFFTAGSPEDGTIGLVVSVPLLIVGLVIAVGTVGHGIVQWEGGTHDEDTGDEDPSAAWVARHRRAISLGLQFVVGVAISALGLLILPAPDESGVQPAATVPVLVVGLLLAISALGRVVTGVWRDDDATDLVPADAAVGGPHAA